MRASQVVYAKLDPTTIYQTIDGFGVNITSKYLNAEQRKTVLDLLVDDLGASIFRVDIWGKSDWIDPHSQSDSSSLTDANLASIYQGEVFQRGWSLMRDLQDRRVQSYPTASGNVPHWMLADDGRTLQDYDSWAKLIVSMLDWAIHKEGLTFSYFSPLNETDIGQPEGPLLDPVGLVRALEVLIKKMGSHKIKLSIADQSRFNAEYLLPLLERPDLMDAVGMFGMHTYTHLPPDRYQSVIQALNRSKPSAPRLWMSEFGDLDQTGEREWYVAWAITERLFQMLEAGFQAALVWDAYDNHHDHDDAWTIYGLLRTGLRLFTPKPRFYALKQVYRFVRPGFQRFHIDQVDSQLKLLAFSSPDQSKLTLTGLNYSPEPVLLNIKNIPIPLRAQQARCYRTTSAENCICAAQVPFWQDNNYPLDGLTVEIAGRSIFTITNADQEA